MVVTEFLWPQSHRGNLSDSKQFSPYLDNWKCFSWKVFHFITWKMIMVNFINGIRRKCSFYANMHIHYREILNLKLKLKTYIKLNLKNQAKSQLCLAKYLYYDFFPRSYVLPQKALLNIVCSNAELLNFLVPFEHFLHQWIQIKRGFGGVCVCVWCWWGMLVSVLVPVCTHAHIYKGQRALSSLYLTPLRSVLPLNRKLSFWWHCLASELPGSAFLCRPTPMLGWQACTALLFHLGSRDSHSGLHACAASSVTAEPSPQPAPPPEVSNDEFVIRYVVIFCKILKQLQAF